MINRTQVYLYLLSLVVALSAYSLTEAGNRNNSNQSAEDASAQAQASSDSTAIFAGGCFWCIEADFEKLEGVNDVVSGYTGGSAETADYKTVSYTETGHFEAVRVSYDPSVVTYAELVEYFWRHIDPTDPHGQFCDKGSSYKSAIFYANAEQKRVIDASLQVLEETKPFSQDIVTEILAAKPFYLAEDYHQDRYKTHALSYRYYRQSCGRDRRIRELWGS